MATPRMTSGFRLLPVKGNDAGAVVAVVSPTASIVVAEIPAGEVSPVNGSAEVAAVCGGVVVGVFGAVIGGEVVGGEVVGAEVVGGEVVGGDVVVESQVLIIITWPNSLSQGLGPTRASA